MAATVLPFEKPVVELVTRVRELRVLAQTDAHFEAELKKLEEKAAKLARELFAELTPWQKVQLSRHPNRPYTLDYVENLFTEWQELHGDRRFADDAAIVCGLGALSRAQRDRRRPPEGAHHQGEGGAQLRPGQPRG